MSSEFARKSYRLITLFYIYSLSIDNSSETVGPTQISNYPISTRSDMIARSVYVHSFKILLKAAKRELSTENLRILDSFNSLNTDSKVYFYCFNLEFKYTFWDY